MKRVGNVFDSILDRENLRLAFHRASLGKRDRADVRLFASQLDDRLSTMAQMVRSGQFPLGRATQFVIHDPKRRVITAPHFSERVLHHAIMNVCEPLLDRSMIEDTFACRKGLGREQAVCRAQSFSKRHAVYLKLDIHKYFESIPHTRLCELVRLKFKDRHLLALIDRIVGSFRTFQRAGLPIGSLMSQHLANFYLGFFDRYVKQSLRLQGYVRYMDDMVLWGQTPSEMREFNKRCEDFIYEKLGLTLNVTTCGKSRHGLNFLGYRIFPFHVCLNRRSKLRFQRKLKDYLNWHDLGLISTRELQSRTDALLSFTRPAFVSSWRFRTAVCNRLVIEGKGSSRYVT